MPEQETTDPAVLFHRPGWQIEPHLFCPRCRHPLLRWGNYRSAPEWIQVVWDPNRSWLPVPWQGFALLVVFLHVAPEVVLLFGSRPGLLVLRMLGSIIGFLGASLYAWMEWRWRLQKRAELEQTLQPHDWVCAKCLHAQSCEAAPTS